MGRVFLDTSETDFYVLISSGFFASDNFSLYNKYIVLTRPFFLYSCTNRINNIRFQWRYRSDRTVPH